MMVEFSSSHPDINTPYQIKHDAVSVKRGTEWKEVHSLVAQRLKIGVLAQRSMEENVPDFIKSDGPSYFLSVKSKEKKWSISWSEGQNPPDTVKKTMNSIIAIKSY
jgi:hypothetical protein